MFDGHEYRETRRGKNLRSIIYTVNCRIETMRSPFKESRLSCSDLRRTEVLFLPQRVEKSKTDCECSFQCEQNDLRETKQTQTLKFRMRYGRCDGLEFALPRTCVSAKLLNGTKLHQPLWRIKVWMILFYVFLIFIFHSLQHEWTWMNISSTTCHPETHLISHSIRKVWLYDVIYN